MDQQEEDRRVPAPAEVVEGIEKIRQTGKANMYSERDVLTLADRMGLSSTFIWIYNNMDEYRRGIRDGYRAVEEEGE